MIRAIFLRTALTWATYVLVVFLSRPSSKACWLSYADAPWPLSPWKEKPGSAQCHWTGVSYPTSQGPGYSRTQPEVQYVIITQKQCKLSKHCLPQFHGGKNLLLRVFQPLFVLMKILWPLVSLPDLAQSVEHQLVFPPARSAVPG